MDLMLIFIAKIVLSLPICPYDSTGSVCNNSKYMVDSKVCAPTCPSLFSHYQLNCPSCENYCSKPATANDAILFTLELSTVKDLTLTYVADSSDSNKKFINPGGISYKSPTQNSPLPTFDRGFYFATTSSMIANQSYIPGIFFLLNLWIKPLASGDILNIQISSATYIRIWADTTVYKCSMLIYNSSGVQVSPTGATTTAYNSSWQKLSVALNQASCAQAYIIFYLNGSPIGTAALANYEIIFPSGTYTWTFGNISGGNSFRGFIYWLQVRVDYTVTHGTVTPTVNCIDNQYLSGSSCVNCDGSCPTWPWCISGTICNVCLLSDCNSCSGYYPLSCSSCNTGLPPYCCDHLGTTCTQTWANTACSTGVPDNAGVCLYGYPYGWYNCGNSCYAVLTVDFTGNFAGVYGSVFNTGTSSSSYNYWNSPEIDDPFPAKNRGLYFNSNQFLAGSINLSNTWSMGIWVFAVSGTIISHSSNKLTISLSGTINFDLEKWDGTSASNSASKSITLNTWNYVSYSVGFANKATTLTPYINNVAGTAVTVTDYVFRLADGGTLYIGKGSPNFNGFISYFQLWGTTVTDFSASYTVYTSAGTTLWPCDYAHYYDGSTCKTCLGSCTIGCTRGTSCYICDDFLCSQCSSFASNSCTLCISNASGTPCTCDPGFYQPINQAICSACYTGCKTCTGSGYHQCTSCKSGFYFLNIQCLSECPWGYLPNSATNSCTLSSTTYGLSFSNNILLDTISGVNVGLSNVNTYPTYDANDPHPAYLRGYYFDYNTYLKTTFMLAPTFSIGMWIKPTAAGLVITKYVSTTQWFVQILNSGYAKLSLLLSDTTTTISVIGTTYLLNQGWFFVSFECKINAAGTTTIKTWTNGANLIAATTATPLYLLDSQSGSMYIGHYDLGFSGFLWTLKIYCQSGFALSDFTTVGCSNSCPKCPADFTCLDGCPLSQYFNGSACTNCRANCLKGCRNSDTCRLCKMKECATCTAFTGANSCLTCITNAVPDGTGGCTCAQNSLWIYSSETCEICDMLCSVCLKNTYFECSTCSGSYQLVGTVCLNSCPYGYGTSCLPVSTAVIDQSFTTDFQGLYGIFTTGTSSLSYNFFNTPETFDPIPAYKRGLYFDGTMVLTSSNILISHSFSIGAWVYVISNGDWFQKQFLLSLSTAVTITVNMEDPLQSSDTQSLTSSTVFSGWTYLSVTFSYSLAVTNLAIYINGASAATTPVTNRIFRDNVARSLWVGRSSSPGFVGFINSFQLWNVPISDFSSYINGLCSSGSSCLWSCDLSHYYDGTNYLACNSCSKGCVRAATCNICNDLLCAICTGFDSGKCIQCVTYANGAPGPCVCITGYGTSPDGFSCVACYSGCSHCTDTGYNKCTACYSGLYLFQNTGQCLNECPSGYSTNSGTNICDYASVVGVSLDLTDQIRFDTVSGFNVGSDNSNAYPNWSDSKDPIPAYKRGYYFYHNNYMSSTVMIAPSFTISIWTKPLGAGILMTKYTSSGIFKINVDSSGYPELSIKFNDNSSLVLTASTSILNSWHFISFTGQVQSDGKTKLALYINNAASPASTTMTTTLTFFKDTNAGSLYIGNDETFTSSGLYGFLARLNIYNSYSHEFDDYATSSCTTGCSVCPANYQCLSECDFNKYPDSCTACSSCSQGCVSGFTCGLCRDKECYSCTTFSGECINCITNAYKLAGHCKCLDNAVWVSSSKTCEFCNAICASCSTIKYNGCITCISGNYLIQSLCITFCSTGYIINGSNCDSDPAYSNFLVFNLRPHQIKDIVVDLASSIPVLTGKDNEFYPNYDTTDPIAAIYRGYYFSGSAYMQLPPYTATSSPLFTFSPKFTISSWIKPITATATIFSKQANSGLFEKYVCLELINKAPSLTISLKDSSTVSYTSSNPSLQVALSQWNFISAISSTSSTPQQTISLSINGVTDTSSDLHASWLNDLENSFFITIGASHFDTATLTSFFKGFLWDLKIYNTPASPLFSSTCNGCSLCPIDNANTCLDSCLIDSYWNGNSCTPCLTVCWGIGCVRSDKNCNLCQDVICEICDDFTNTCITCKTNANLIGVNCQCNSGYYWNTNDESCELCDISCKTCTSSSPLDCLMCKSGYYMFSGVCLAVCPAGYSPSSGVCIKSKEKIFDLDLNTLNGVIYDKANSIPVVTGSTIQFYPDYEADDPIPAYLRGFWFNGQSSLLRLPEYSNYISPKLLVTPTFTISIWLNIESPNSVLLSKYSITDNYSVLYSISIMSNKPAISLIINTSPFVYSCQTSLTSYEWNHLEFSLEALSGYNIMSSYINGIFDYSAMTGYGTFNDIGSHTTMTIGAQISSSAVYNYYQGFIYTVQIFNALKPISSLSTTSCTESCSVCPISQVCIPNCKIKEYWSGPAYNKCNNCDFNCKTTCKDSQPTCSLCNNLLCKDCTDCSSSGCITCKENAINSDFCTCDTSYVLDPSNNSTCIPIPSGGFKGTDGYFYPCPSLCAACESLTKCSACKENASLKNDLCYCNSGYNGTKSCISVSFYANLKALSDNSLYLYFSESLANNLTVTDFTITIENQGKISCKIEQVNSTCYYISLSISKEIAKGTLATLEFLNLNNIRSVSNGILNSSEISAALNSYDPAPYSPIVSTIASQAKAAALIAVSGAVALSVLNPSPSSLWSIMNVLQILSYLTLSGIPLSSKISTFLNNLNSYNLFPNIFQYFIDENEGNAPYSKAQDFGFESDLILITTGNDFTLLLTSISALPIVYFFSRCSYKWIGKKFRKTVQAYQFAFYLRFWIQCYLELGAASAIGLLSVEFSNVTKLNNFIICSAVCILLILTPPAFFLFSYKNKNRIQSREKSFFASFSSLFYEFRTDRGLLGTQYYCVFFLRRLIYIINLVYLRDFPQTEVTINIVLSLMTIMHLWFFWPFEDSILQVSNFLTEILIFLIMSATSVYLFDLEQEIVSIVENAIIATVVTAIGIQSCASIAIFGKTLYGVIKNKLTKAGIMKKNPYEYKKQTLES
ncbi:unnamed protein product [Blepharisma stoltei]|uniref:TNFR-Cys domain-containing protein n=1 Tax=Blepharisma stoltei TaxID=1481888 RepID=A0AAU9KD05_9CILI|nr:unnamed protein product [Blepharisma stoltei]